MTIHYRDAEVTVHHGDCLDVLAELPDASVDAVVTDPPYNLSFMSRAWDRIDGSTIDPGFLHWFAGFVDGEGCFSVHKKPHPSYDCQFSITLRADDRPILERIHRTLRIGTLSKPTAHAGGPDNPKARYSVSSQRDCVILRDLLRAFPLRAKKATDFEIWSDALDEWLKHERGEWDSMSRLRDDLMQGRAYKDEGVRVDPFQMWCWRWARECLRVLKPGGHLLAFGGSRTWHRLAAGIEDAGFEIRDSIAWLYGSGFPKSLDVSKAIDKRRDDEADIRAVCRWLRAHISSHPSQTIATIAERFGFHPRMVEHWAARDTDSQPALPTLEQWDVLRELLSFDDALDAEVYRLNLRKGEPGEAWAGRAVVGTVDEWANRTNYALTSRDGLRRGASTNPEAQQWEGWGTALKPAFEPIVVARKPLSGTVAANVLANGTGALNIDGCRIEAHDDQLAEKYASVQNAGSRANTIYGADARSREGSAPHAAGRWPANVVLDEQQAAELDQQTGVSQSRIGKPRGAASGDGWGMTYTGAEYDDVGGASRFFPVFRYEAKAPTAERPTYQPTRLRLRSDLTPEQVDQVTARLREAGVDVA